MGYYTYYEIKAREKDGTAINEEKMNKIADELKDISEYCFESSEGELDSGDTIKWYKYENDMKKLSEKYHDILFQVDGDGEESGDIWRTYYLGGKAHQVATRRTYDEFNSSLLK